MRAYKIELPPGVEIIYRRAFAGSMVDARVVRRMIAADHCVALEQIKISDINIPTGKIGLLAFLNNLVK